ncbi:outer membrane protein/protective antigen OMA87 [Belliella baltica DSM 15883]|uniref:Outer membrane protein/protective antigen OMA87 n=1 Tax=Belliella baltica (strain DSM 15883 / CIP 108006 / LMG 21964 / BA134) TaxID=866536 RepID=I3Z9H5_BELBD|nr:BamA/TamA family outer membrane protein [Belliella baltica]AFL85893.1 outer membrane protein/protective antigen OMA87 [Belliella baltica DSM 15883]
MKKQFLIIITSIFLGQGVLLNTPIKAQDTDSLFFEDSILDVPQTVTINNIFIIGNQKTRKNIILRELNFSSGISYDWEDLIMILAADQKKIFNLQLFNSVEITPLLTGEEQIEILITVDERRYFIPSIIFELADRNFSEWWTNQNRSLKRVNYEARFYHNNVGGRNEKMRLSAQFGFTQAFDLRYSFPYIDRNQKHGLTTQVSYLTNKTISVRSAENKQVFFTNENEDVLRRLFSLFGRYSYRGSFYNFHFITMGFNNIQINEDVLTQNENYFLHNDTNLRYFLASYSFRHDRRNYNSYPTNGALLDLGITKYGLFGSDDFKDWEFTGIASRYFPINNKVHFASSLYVNAFAGKRQPFTSVRGVGYNPNFIRGYELNVIEGQQSAVHKNSVRYNLLDLEYDISNISPISGFTNFPIKLYFSANFDHGYVNDRNRIPENLRLTNKYLFGYGPGLDLVIFYDLVFRFEYSRNNQNEGNFFINFEAPF